MAGGLNIDDNGFASVKIGGEEREIDVYHVWNAVTELHQKCADEGRPNAFLGEVADLLVQRVGFTRVSHFAADKFATALGEMADRLGNDPEGEPTPGSPSTTAPRPSLYRPGKS